MLKNITRVVWVLSLVSMFADVASEMLYPVIPVYLKNIGFSVFLIGLLEGIAEATAGISKGYFGNWSDNLGRRMPFVRWGYFISAVSKSIMAFWKYPVWVFFTRTADRVGKGLRTAPRDAMLSAEATSKTKGEIFSFHRAMDTLGAVLGPLAALLFLYFYPGHYVTLFYIAFIPGIIAMLITFLIKEKRSPSPKKKRTGFLSFFKYWKRSRGEYRKLLIALIIFALFNSSDMLLLLKVKEASGSETTALLAYIFYNLLYAIGAFPFGLLADRLGMKNIFVVGLLLFSATYFGMSFISSVPGFFVLFGIYGLFMAATEGISKAWLSNLVRKEETGTAIGLFVSLQSIALMIASAFAGLLWSFYGASVTFLLTACMGAGVSLFILFFLRNPKADSDEVPSAANHH